MKIQDQRIHLLKETVELQDRIIELKEELIEDLRGELLGELQHIGYADISSDNGIDDGSDSFMIEEQMTKSFIRCPYYIFCCMHSRACKYP